MNLRTSISDLLIIILLCTIVYALYTYVWDRPAKKDKAETARYSNEQYSDLESDSADVKLMDSCEGILDTELAAACRENFIKKSNAEN